MNTLVIERQALMHNFQQVKKRAKGAELVGDLSGDAYGLGLLETARLLADEGVHSFAVSSAREAERLRDGGFTEETIMSLRSTSSRGELELLVELGVVCAVGSYETGVILNAVAQGRNTVCEVRIMVDSGVGRYGFKPWEMDKIYSVYCDMESLHVVGTFTELSDPAGKSSHIRDEFNTFTEVTDSMRGGNFDPGRLACGGGLAIVRFDYSCLDSVLIGKELGGDVPRRFADDFKRAAYIESSIEQVDWFNKGVRVGGKKLGSPRRVGILPVGSLNGFGVEPRKTRKKLGFERAQRPLLITVGSSKAPVMGAVGLFDSAVDLTAIECRVGDVAVMEVEAGSVKGIARAYR